MKSVEANGMKSGRPWFQPLAEDAPAGQREQRLAELAPRSPFWPK